METFVLQSVATMRHPDVERPLYSISECFITCRRIELFLMNVLVKIGGILVECYGSLQ